MPQENNEYKNIKYIKIIWHDNDIAENFIFCIEG